MSKYMKKILAIILLASLSSCATYTLDAKISTTDGEKVEKNDQEPKEDKTEKSVKLKFKK